MFKSQFNLKELNALVLSFYRQLYQKKNSIAEDMFKQSQHNIQGMQQNYEAL